MEEPNTERAGSETPGQLAERINLQIGPDLRLLTRALTHRSYVNEHPDVPSDNERLEFLGDAVLDFVVGAWVYNHYPEMAEGELQAGGRDRDALLCATFEAIIGAIYQCKGLEDVKTFAMPLFESAADDIIVQMTTIDPKSRLQEWTQAQGLGIPRYITAQSEGPDHAKMFSVEVHINGQCIGTGYGASKHAAQEAAAQNAFELIESGGINLTE